MKVHSIVKLITNSSTEIYTIVDPTTPKQIVDLMNDIVG